MKMQIYEQQKELCEYCSWPKWDPNLELTHTHQLGVEEEHNKHNKMELQLLIYFIQ
jgi:hypothetical protein